MEQGKRSQGLLRLGKGKVEASAGVTGCELTPRRAGPDSYLHSPLTVLQADEVTHTDAKGMSPTCMQVWPPSGAT